MNNFKFEFDGSISVSYQIDDVKISLAKMFEVNSNELNVIFNDEKIFVRNDIDQFTAESYHDAFLNIGAIGHIIQGELRNSNQSIKQKLLLLRVKNQFMQKK